MNHRQGLVIAYPVEILPYELRAKGLQLTFFGVSTNGRSPEIINRTELLTSTVINQYVNPVGIQNIGWKFYIVSLAKRFFDIKQIIAG